jgi:hypothetical protein
MRRIHAVWVAAALTLPLLAGCESAPRASPVKMGPVDTGSESVEAARRQLQGTWELTALEILSPAGQRTAVQASARLQYDDYGNLSMKGTITGGPAIDPSVLNLSGRVAIDPVAHTLKFEAITAATADERRIDPALDASRVRYYEFAGDLLKTTVKAADGSPTAIATWKRLP